MKRTAIRIGVLAAALTGCGTLYPTNEEVAPPAGAAEATKVALDAWADHTEIPTQPHPEIRWFDGSCLDYRAIDDCLPGWYFSASREIHIVTDNRLSNTVLAHELLHWSLHVRTSDVDEDHEDPAWEHVFDVRKRIYEVGL